MTQQNFERFTPVEEKEKENPMIEESEPTSWLVALACLSFFPLLYLLGKTVMSWLG